MFLSKLFITLDSDPNLDLDPIPNMAKILDPDTNSKYLDPQHWDPQH